MTSSFRYHHVAVKALDAARDRGEQVVLEHERTRSDGTRRLLPWVIHSLPSPADIATVNATEMVDLWANLKRIEAERDKAIAAIDRVREVIQQHSWEYSNEFADFNVIAIQWITDALNGDE